VNLLIHGPPGSRLGFVAAVLQNKLLNNLFDVGAHLEPEYVKLHEFDQEIISSFPDTKICIHTTFDMLDRHFLLFYQKNVITVLPERFQNLHVTNRKILDRLYYSFSNWASDDAIARAFNLYDYNINFEQTFDVEFMCDLYFQVNKKMPSSSLIEAIQTTNQTNFQPIELNHSCKIAAEIIKFERQNNFTEDDRSWQLDQACDFTDSGECLDPDNLYNNVMSKLSVEFYQGPIDVTGG